MTGPELMRSITARNETARRATVDDPAHPCTRTVMLDAIVENQKDSADFLSNGGLTKTIADAIAVVLPSPEAQALVVATALKKYQNEHSTLTEAIAAFGQWTPKEKMASIFGVIVAVFMAVNFIHNYRAAATEEEKLDVIRHEASILSNGVHYVTAVADQLGMMTEQKKQLPEVGRRE